MNVKRTPLTAFCLLLSLVFYICSPTSPTIHSTTTVEGLVAVVSPALPALSLCSLVLALVFFSFERLNGTHEVCHPQDVSQLFQGNLTPKSRASCNAQRKKLSSL